MFKQLRVWAIVPALVLASACGGGSTEPELGTVRGTVRDNSGNALPSVSFLLSRTGRTPKSATSNVNGEFTFPRVEPGTWSLEITIPSDYTLPQTQPNPAPVSVAGERTATVTVTLNRKPAGPGGPGGPTVTTSW
jgi:hypothetical protein